MRNLTSGIIAVSLLGLMVGASMNTGCAAAPEDDVPATAKKKTTPADDDDVAVSADDDDDSSASGDDDSSKPVEKDGGTKKPDAAPEPPPPPPPPPPPVIVGPAEGSDCAKEDEIFNQGCGFCGNQQAICKGGKVSKYGVCQGSVPNGCVPGTTDTATCGLCGTQQRQCQNDCSWAAGACKGEPTNACEPSSTKYITAGCPSAGTYRVATCGATCTVGDYSPTCAAPVNANKLTVSQTVNNEVGGTYTMGTALQMRRVNGYSCSSATLGTERSPYAYVEVANKGAKAAKVTVYTKKATGGEELDTVLWTYPGDLPPQDDAATMKCTALSDGCSGTTPSNICGNSGNNYSSMFAGIGNVVVPANGKILVYVSTKSSEQVGPVQLKIRTDALN